VPARMVREDGLSGVHLERALDAPIDEVWDALTRPERIGRWLWPVVEWPDDPARSRRLRAGDRFALGDANMREPQRFEVADLDEERELTLRWRGSEVELVVALSDHPSGTMLRLRQSPTPDRMAGGALRSGADFGAGWHSIVDALVGYLADIPMPDGDAMWRAAYAIYLAQQAGWG